MRPASAPSLKPNRHKNMHHKKSSSNRQKNRSTSRYGNAYTSFTNSMLAQRKFNELQSTGKFMTYNEMIKSVQKYSDTVDKKLRREKISTPAIIIKTNNNNKNNTLRNEFTPEYNNNYNNSHHNTSNKANKQKSIKRKKTIGKINNNLI